MSNELTVSQANSLVISSEEARSLVEAINNSMANTRALLYELYTRRGWEALGYASWRECAIAEFDQSKSHLYRQLEAAEIEAEVSPKGEIGKIPETYLRPLAALPSGTRAEAYQEAQSIAPDGKVTAKIVEQVVAKRLPPKPPRKPRQSSKIEQPVNPPPSDVIEGVVIETPNSPALTFYRVIVGENVGAWLVAAPSPDEARELVAIDQLIPIANLKCEAYETEGITIVATGMSQILFGGMWRKAEAPRPAERPMAKPTVNYPPASSPAPRAVGMPQRTFNPAPKNLHDERSARKEGAPPERKQARHDEEFES